MNVPPWFLKVTAACAAMATVGGIPWATWVTYTLVSLSTSADTAKQDREQLAAVQRGMTELSTKLEVINATKFTAADVRPLMSGLEVRLDRIDSNVQALQREFDRSLGKRGTPTGGPES